MVSTRSNTPSKEAVKHPATPASRKKAARTKKVKNKVSSPPAVRHPLVADEVDSDEFNYEEESESVAQEPESDLESAGSGRRRLPTNLLQQLALDIHARGGIALFNLENKQGLADLCDQRIELYGDRGGDTRKRIQKKVQKWRELTPTGYLGVLRKLGVQFTDSEPEIFEREKKPAAKKATGALTSPSANPVPASAIPVPTIPASVSVPASSSVRSVESNTSLVATVNSFASTSGAKMSTFQNTSK